MDTLLSFSETKNKTEVFAIGCFDSKNVYWKL